MSFSVRLFEFAIASAIIEITPGPNMSYLMSVTLARGIRPALGIITGITTGLAIMGLLVAFGLAEFFERYPLIDTVFKWGGIAFMLWLAIDAWNDSNAKPSLTPHANPNAFARGLITNLLNLKLLAFYFVMLPEFTDVSNGNLLLQNLTLVFIYVAVATIIHVGIVMVTGLARKSFLQKTSKILLSRIMAALLVGVAFWMFWETKQ